MATDNKFWYLQDLSPQTKEWLKDAIENAKKVKNSPDFDKLPSKIKKEVYELLEASAHPALSNPKVTVSRMIHLAKKLTKFTLFQERDRLEALIFAIRKARELQKLSHIFKQEGQLKIARKLMKLGAQLMAGEGDFNKVLEIADAYRQLGTEEKKLLKFLPSGNVELALARTDAEIKKVLPFLEKVKGSQMGDVSNSAVKLLKEVDDYMKSQKN